jgi:DNA helicase MCM8
MVKAGMLLSLFGGVRKKLRGSGEVPVRGSIHCLLVGDPGLGKSQLLKAASGLAPRGMYVSGRSVSKAGLTATVVKDAGTGGYAFEAGAMVLSDGGVCCVDEFDKMPSEHAALLEAMEQQSVSVAKAGLTATLPARAAVLAAANPAGGVYNRSRTVHENIKMSPALLSRFDLCFILLDVPDEELDDKLSRHVLAPHGTGGAPRLTEARQELLAHRAHADSDDDDDDDDARRKRTRAGAPGFLASQSQPFDRDADRVSLKRQLRLDLNGADAEFAPLPRGLMRKYVAYAAAYCHPRLTPPAAEVLQEYYLELRARSAAGADVTPITPRQLESLCRLAEARAKVELRETVTRSDALDAVEIMRESLREVMSGNALGKGFSGKGGKPNKRGKAKLFVDGMNARAREKQSAYFTAGELHALADDLRLELKDVDGFIESLNVAGEILKSGRLYKSAGS